MGFRESLNYFNQASYIHRDRNLQIIHSTKLSQPPGCLSKYVGLDWDFNGKSQDPLYRPLGSSRRSYRLFDSHNLHLSTCSLNLLFSINAATNSPYSAHAPLLFNIRSTLPPLFQPFFDLFWKEPSRLLKYLKLETWQCRLLVQKATRIVVCLV